MGYEVTDEMIEAGAREYAAVYEVSGGSHLEATRAALAAVAPLIEAQARAENENLRLSIRKALADLSEYGEAWTGAMIGCVRRDLKAALSPSPAAQAKRCHTPIACERGCTGDCIPSPAAQEDGR